MSAPVAGGQVRGGRVLVADVMLLGMGSRDVHLEAAGRVAPGSPVALGSPVARGRVALGSPVARGRVVPGSPVALGNRGARGRVVPGSPVKTGSPAVVSAARGSGVLGAAQA